MTFNEIPSGKRVYIESHFIDFLRSIFSDVDDMKWTDDPSTRDLYIGSSMATDDLETIPRVIVGMSDMTELGSSINNLKDFRTTGSDYLYVDQTGVTITCFSEVEQEASDMAYWIRRMILLARDDFRKREIFGIRNPTVTVASPNAMGAFKDHLYGSTIQVSFMIPNRESVLQGENYPFFEELEIIPGDGGSIGVLTNYPQHWGALPPIPTFTSVTGVEEEGEVVLYLKANHPVHPYRPVGISVHRGATEFEAVVTGDPQDAFGYVVEIPTRYLFGMSLTYTPGNIVSRATGTSFVSFSRGVR